MRAESDPRIAIRTAGKPLETLGNNSVLLESRPGTSGYVRVFRLTSFASAGERGIGGISEYPDLSGRIEADHTNIHSLSATYVPSGYGADPDGVALHENFTGGRNA
jgi:hypothetical protein